MEKYRAAITPQVFKPSSVFRAGRDMPEGSIGWHVDCADNPLDLRPAVATILRAIDERRAALPEDRILVVPVGENHKCPTQVWVFTLLAKEMKARGYDFVVSLERSHDTWKRNKISTALSLEYARINEAPIVLASHGSGHIFGNALKENPYKDSLDALSGKQAAVMPVFMTIGRSQTGLNILEEAALPSLKHSVVIDGLGEEGFLYGPHDNGEPGSPTYLAEAAYVDQIRKATGGALPGF